MFNSVVRQTRLSVAKMLIQRLNKKTINNIEKVERKTTKTDEPDKNRDKNLCPLKNKFLTKNVFYKATVTLKIK